MVLLFVQGWRNKGSRDSVHYTNASAMATIQPESILGGVSRNPGDPCGAGVPPAFLPFKRSLFLRRPVFWARPFSALSVQMSGAIKPDQAIGTMIFPAKLPTAEFTHLVGSFKTSIYRTNWQRMSTLSCMCVVMSPHDAGILVP